MAAKDRLLEVLFPWDTWQEWGIVSLVVVVTFFLYYAVLFPAVGRVYFASLAHKGPQQGVEVLYFPYAASLANSEAWIIARTSKSAATMLMFKIDPQDKDAEVRWGCGQESNAWFCEGHPPEIELTSSPLDIFNLRYSILPPRTFGRILHLWWESARGKQMAQFQLVESIAPSGGAQQNPVSHEGSPKNPVGSGGAQKSTEKRSIFTGDWPRIYYDPWRVFWWQVVYRNLLWPPWGNVVLLGFAFLIARLITEYLLPPEKNLLVGTGKCGQGIQRVGDGLVWLYRKVPLVGIVILANIAAFGAVLLFFVLMSSAVPMVLGDVLSAGILTAVLWCGFSWLGGAVSFIYATTAENRPQGGSRFSQWERAKGFAGDTATSRKARCLRLPQSSRWLSSSPYKKK